jgi:hypothetical protein
VVSARHPCDPEEPREFGSDAVLAGGSRTTFMVIMFPDVHSKVDYPAIIFCPLRVCDLNPLIEEGLELRHEYKKALEQKRASGTGGTIDAAKVKVSENNETGKEHLDTWLESHASGCSYKARK